jgi:hypothetical protein
MAKSYQLVPVADGSQVKGGLSHANGNCVMVERSDNSYVITDSKLGIASPRWALSDEQFRRFGQLLARWLSWVDVKGEETADLGNGMVLTVRCTAPGYVFSLTGCSDLAFSVAEYRAFCWGYVNGQFRSGVPVRRLRFKGENA